MMKILKTLLFERQFLLERILVLAATISGVVNLFFINQYEIQLKIFQYLLIPFMVTFFALPKLSKKRQALRDGILIGVLSGLPSAFTAILILLYQYYFLDYRSIIATQGGHLPEPITVTTVLLTIEGGMIIGFFSIILSAVSGLIAWLFAHNFVSE